MKIKSSLLFRLDPYTMREWDATNTRMYRGQCDVKARVWVADLIGSNGRERLKSAAWAR